MWLLNRYDRRRWWMLLRDRIAMRLSVWARAIASEWAWDQCPECGQERYTDVPGTPWNACGTDGCSLQHWVQPPNLVRRKGRAPGCTM